MGNAARYYFPRPPGNLPAGLAVPLKEPEQLLPEGMMGPQETGSALKAGEMMEVGLILQAAVEVKTPMILVE